jgi:ubiquinone/menaquinone biosynthesis C-methylase UbiE
MSEPVKQDSALWSAVDQSGTGAALADYLSRASAHGSVQDYKRRSFAALRLKPGDRVLDVGCGAGTDVRALAQLVGKTGRAVGLDFSEDLLAHARRQTSADDPIDYQQGDAATLPFPDASFDACRSDRVLQHLVDPAAALAAMLRVTRRDGWVVVTEPDWDTLVIDVPGHLHLTRRILASATETLRRHGCLGRELPRLFRRAGFADLEIAPEVIFMTDYPLANEGAALERGAERAREDGVVSATEAITWIDALRATARDNEFWTAVTVFTVAGHRPAT